MFNSVRVMGVGIVGKNALVHWCSLLIYSCMCFVNVCKFHIALCVSKGVSCKLFSVAQKIQPDQDCQDCELVAFFFPETNSVVGYYLIDKLSFTCHLTDFF